MGKRFTHLRKLTRITGTDRTTCVKVVQALRQIWRERHGKERAMSVAWLQSNKHRSIFDTTNERMNMAHATPKVILSTPRNIGELRVKPKEHPSLLLGTFSEDQPPAGFSISIHPDPVPANSVTTRVAAQGPRDRYKLVLHVANNSTRTVGIHVSQI